MLRQVTHFTAFADGHTAACGRTHPGDNLQQGRFAGSVLSHQGDPVLVTDGERDVFEKCRAAELYGQGVY